MTFDSIWQRLSKMDSGIIATLVVESNSIAISTLRIDIYSFDSREFTVEVVFEFFNVIVLASGVTMAGSNQIGLMNVLIPWILTLVLSSLMNFRLWWRWMICSWFCDLATTALAAHDLSIFYLYLSSN